MARSVGDELRAQAVRSIDDVNCSHRKAVCNSHVEAKVGDVAVFDDVLFALEAELAGFAGCGFAAELDEVAPAPSAGLLSGPAQRPRGLGPKRPDWSGRFCQICVSKIHKIDKIQGNSCFQFLTRAKKSEVHDKAMVSLSGDSPY